MVEIALLTCIWLWGCTKYLDENCRIMIYKTFISSNFNYCPVSWMFCGKANVNKLEKLQERASRFVFRDTTSSYENLLTRRDFLPLSVHRIRCLGSEVYKCFNGLNPNYLNNLFKRPSLKYELRDSHRLEQPNIQYIYIRTEIVSLLWIQIMECITIFGEKHEMIACT